MKYINCPSHTQLPFTIDHTERKIKPLLFLKQMNMSKSYKPPSIHQPNIWKTYTFLFDLVKKG